MDGAGSFGRLPADGGKDLSAAVISRQCFSRPSQVVMADHQALVELLNMIIDGEPFHVTVGSLRPLFMKFMAGAGLADKAERLGSEALAHGNSP